MTTSLNANATMTTAACAVVVLWDTAIERAEQLELDDWSRPTPDSTMDVRDLIVHLTTSSDRRTPAPTNAELVEQLRVVREEQAMRLADLADAADAAAASGVSNSRDGRLLQANCLDMLVHSHDFAAAMGQTIELDASPVVTEAARYLLPMAHHLGQPAAGAGDLAALQIEVVDLDEIKPTGPAPTNTVRLTSAALVLLLSGRAQPDEWKRTGALTWSGPLGEAFVREARLFG